MAFSHSRRSWAAELCNHGNCPECGYTRWFEFGDNRVRFIEILNGALSSTAWVPISDDVCIHSFVCGECRYRVSLTDDSHPKFLILIELIHRVLQTNEEQSRRIAALDRNDPAAILSAQGIEILDLRKYGYQLCVKGGVELSSLMNEIAGKGFSCSWVPRGGITRWNSAWYITSNHTEGDPAEV